MQDNLAYWPFTRAGLTQLNHGSFGAVPAPVLAAQSAWRAKFQANPTGFIYDQLDEAWALARARLASFIGADAAGFVFVRNATEGVNTVLASYPFKPDDEIIVTSHGYNACINAAHKWGGKAGAKVVMAALPFPAPSAEALINPILAAITSRTRLAVLDHITSPTALVLPIKRLIDELQARGIAVLVDGAHAPGQIPLDIDALGADFYTGNCHKWLCAPPGAAFLWVSDKWRERIEPLVISHGYNDKNSDRSRLHKLFDWQGTGDFTGVLCLPEVLDFMAQLHPQGHAGLMARNHALALEARELLGWAMPAPADMLGAMASVIWTKGNGAVLRERLLAQHKIMLWSGNWPSESKWVMRLSAFAYNEKADYEKLARAIA